MTATTDNPRYSRQQVRDSLEAHFQARARSTYARERPRVLRAAGVRITAMSAERMRAVAGSRQSWQALAWGYRDMIGELRGATQFRARAISKASFHVAELVEGDDEPIPVALRNETDDEGNPTERAQRVTLPDDICTAAEQELGRLPLDAGMAFQGMWSENFDVAGEAWLYGHLDDDGEEVWEIRAFDAVDVQGSQVTIKDDLDQPRPVDLSAESSQELYRLWVPHTRTPRLADSPLRACMDSLEDITLIGREMRAASRSRIAANGIAFFPEGFLERQNVQEDDEQTAEDKFIADLTAAFLAPITNEGDAGAVVPAALFASIEDIKGFRFQRFDRETSPELTAKLDRALGRMAQSIDVPPEIVTGMADVNHWSAWQIDASTFRYYLEPGLRLMADSLTGAYLRRKLKALKFPPEQVNKIRVWFSAGQITENPNRRADAIDAYDRLAIGPAAFRDALGFSEGDAPTTEEALMIVASKQGMDIALATQLLAEAARRDGAEVPNLRSTPPTPQRALPGAQPDPTGVGGTGTPDTAPPGIQAAAATPPYTVDTELGRELAGYEQQLRDRILLAADAAITRAIQRASSRLRSKAQADKSLTADLRAYPVQEWAAVMGRDQALGLGADVAFLLREAWDDLREKFTTWTTETATKIAQRLGRYLGRPETADRIARAMEDRIPDAWTLFGNLLNPYVDRKLFNEPDPSPDGETPMVALPPAFVRAALALVGGLPSTAVYDPSGVIPGGEALTGLADGTLVTHELAQHDIHLLGREWRYNPLLERDTFHPHHKLDGERFTSWTDPKLRTDAADDWIGTHYRPGDHRGCLCDSVPAYLIPRAPRQPPGADPAADALANQIRERLSQPSQAMAELIVLAEGDDRAGRSGTTAQTTRDQWLEIQDLQSQYLNGE